MEIFLFIGKMIIKIFTTVFFQYVNNVSYRIIGDITNVFVQDAIRYVVFVTFNQTNTGGSSTDNFFGV